MLDKKSKISAKLDFWQSATGLILGVFIIFHLCFESSILISAELFNTIAKMLEMEFLFDGGEPLIVSFLAIFIFIVFIAHAFFAMRKFPQKYNEFKIFKNHSDRMNHTDTKIWLVQIITGFVLFFTATVHLYLMATDNKTITAISSSLKMTDDMMAPLFIVLLIAVVSHAFIGLYRLAVKWIPMSKIRRIQLMKLRNLAIVAFTILGLLSILKYIQIGLAN